jgi:hypothetical protein
MCGGAAFSGREVAALPVHFLRNALALCGARGKPGLDPLAGVIKVTYGGGRVEPNLNYAHVSLGLCKPEQGEMVKSREQHEGQLG